MLPELKVFFKLVTVYANELVLVFTALCGYFLQYSYSKEKGMRVAFLMFVSAIFTGSLLHMALTHNGINAGNMLHTFIIASSASISSAIVTFFITVASLLSSSGPAVIFKKFEDFIETYGRKTVKEKPPVDNQSRRSYESEHIEKGDNYRE